MTKDLFLSLINSKTVFLDGATGTQLQAHGMPFGQPTEEWVLQNPDVLKSIQSEYIAAGSDIIYAPTFSANRVKLQNSPLGNNIYETNKQLVSLTKDICANALVAGDVSPIGKMLSMEMNMAECIDVYKEQITALCEAGVDLIVAETMIDIAEARAAVIAARQVCDLPVICTMVFDESMRCTGGTDALTAMVILQSEGVSAFGANCGTGPETMLKLIDTIASKASVPIIAKPNAGMPVIAADGSVSYKMSAGEFAAHSKKLADSGASILGGCCGTSPAHIRELTKAVGTAKRPTQSTPLKALASSLAYCEYSDDLTISEPLDISRDTTELTNAMFMFDESIDVIRLVCTGECDVETVIPELSLYTSKPFWFDISDESILSRAKTVYNGKGVW